MPKEYKTIQEVAGPLMMVEQVEGATYNELGEIELANGEIRRCRVLEVNGDKAVVQLFENAAGINLAESKVRFLGHGLELGVSSDMLGRVFDGMGQAHRRRSGYHRRRNASTSTAQPMNPAARDYPSEFIQTGDFRHRRTEHAGARAEAADLFRLAVCRTQILRRRSRVRRRCAARIERFAVVFAAHGYHL